MFLQKRIIDDYLNKNTLDKKFSSYLEDRGYFGLCIFKPSYLFDEEGILNSNSKVISMLSDSKILCTLKGNKTNYLHFEIREVFKRSFFRKVPNGYSLFVNGNVVRPCDIYSFAVQIDG